MKTSKKKAFTLTELLVVVIVLGVLASVAVPKFSRVLETRRTTEAENMLSAVRAEQEKRCVLGQNYTGNFANIPTVAYAKVSDTQAKSANYTYTLNATGVTASREDYELKILSYKSGELCCAGSGCAKLNKSYPACGANTVSDECAATDIPATSDPVIECSGTKPAETQICNECGTQTRSVSCDTSNGTWVTGTWGACSKTEQECRTCPNEPAEKTKTESCSSGYTGEITYRWNDETCGWEELANSCEEEEPAECEDGETDGEETCNGCGTRTTRLCVDGRWTVSFGECDKTEAQCKCQPDDLHKAGERNEFGICPCRYGQPFNIATGAYNEAACCAPDGSSVPSNAGCCGSVSYVCDDEDEGAYDSWDVASFSGLKKKNCTFTCGDSGSSSSASCSWQNGKNGSDLTQVDYQAGDLFRMIDNASNKNSIDVSGATGFGGNCGDSCTQGMTCRKDYRMTNCQATGDKTSDGKINAYKCTLTYVQQECVCQ